MKNKLHAIWSEEPHPLKGLGTNKQKIHKTLKASISQKKWGENASTSHRRRKNITKHAEIKNSNKATR